MGLGTSRFPDGLSWLLGPAAWAYLCEAGQLAGGEAAQEFSRTQYSLQGKYVS